MDIKKNFGTSLIQEEQGAWIDIGEGASIKVARAGNKANRALLKRLVAPHKLALRHDRVPDDVLEKITIETMAETILLDWKGIEEDGRPLLFSRDNALRLLTDYKDFREQVSSFSNDLATFQADRLEAEVKN